MTAAGLETSHRKPKQGYYKHQRSQLSSSSDCRHRERLILEAYPLSNSDYQRDRRGARNARAIGLAISRVSDFTASVEEYAIKSADPHYHRYVHRFARIPVKNSEIEPLRKSRFPTHRTPRSMVLD